MLALLDLLMLPVWLAAPPPAPATSVALHDDRVVVGTESGLYQNESGGWALVLTRGGVRDLARSKGRLLIATAGGLYAWETGAERPSRIPLGAGARVRSVASDAADTEWVGADSGLFARPRASRSFRREPSLPSGAVTAVRTSPAGVWAAMRGAIWHRSGTAPFERALPGLEDGWWELRGAVEFEGASLLCVPRGLWRLDAGGARRLELGIGELRGMSRVGSTLWVASERGAYPYALAGLEREAPEAVVHADAVDLVRAGDRLLVATRRGVASIPLSSGADAALALRGLRSDGSEIRRLQRAVLAYLEISPSRIARVEERARRSAWIPEVRATMSFDQDRERDRKHDEVFSSGRVRDLFDTSSESDRSVGVDLVFVWKLARAATPDQALQISRERRQLVELRDQVLERVNRLYFERLRVLARLQALGPGAAGTEAAELTLRARELSAHLDAWSGGTFSRLEARSAGSRTGRP